jgi:hypothetical protein
VAATGGSVGSWFDLVPLRGFSLRDNQRTPIKAGSPNSWIVFIGRSADVRAVKQCNDRAAKRLVQRLD